MLGSWWFSIVVGGPTLAQHWVNVSFFPGSVVMPVEARFRALVDIQGGVVQE